MLLPPAITVRPSTPGALTPVNSSGVYTLTEVGSVSSTSDVGQSHDDATTRDVIDKSHISLDGKAGGGINRV